MDKAKFCLRFKKKTNGGPGRDNPLFSKKNENKFIDFNKILKYFECNQ
jgi:hypothetical protein